MSKTRKIISKILKAVTLGLIVFVAWNVYSSRDVTTVDQSSVPEIENSQEKSNNRLNLLYEARLSGANNYKVEGGMAIIQVDGKRFLKFSKDFSSTPGPDLFVYLSENVMEEGLGEFVSLGRLRSLDGEQSYALPEDLDNYKSVVIWCRAFNTSFGGANL